MEGVFFDIIGKKRASLIAAGCASGASAAGQPLEAVQRMHKFGEHTGIAFQIKDDLFDYGNGEDIGKPTGLDIKEKKLTLPLIYSLDKVSKSDRRWMIDVVKNKNEDDRSVKRLVEMVSEAGGIAHAHARMLEYRDKAIGTLPVSYKHLKLPTRELV